MSSVMKPTFEGDHMLLVSNRYVHESWVRSKLYCGASDPKSTRKIKAVQSLGGQTQSSILMHDLEIVWARSRHKGLAMSHQSGHLDLDVANSLRTRVERYSQDVMVRRRYEQRADLPVEGTSLSRQIKTSLSPDMALRFLVLSFDGRFKALARS